VAVVVELGEVTGAWWIILLIALLGGFNGGFGGWGGGGYAGGNELYRGSTSPRTSTTASVTR
jgi:hypothetical protein